MLSCGGMVRLFSVSRFGGGCCFSNEVSPFARFCRYTVSVRCCGFSRCACPLVPARSAAINKIDFKKASIPGSVKKICQQKKIGLPARGVFFHWENAGRNIFFLFAIC